MLDLGRQSAQRLKAWRTELFRHQFVPVGKVSFEGFTTFDHLTREQAEGHARRPFPVGEKWGQCWEYAWFIGDVTLGPECEGKRVVLLSNVGGEQLVYSNGKAIGSVDKGHPYVTLTREARAGERFHLQIETYAGHGARLENLDPCPPERRAIPETPEAQCVVGDTIVAVWNEDAYQLLIDVVTLDRLLQALPDNSLRAQKVAKALMDFTHIADFELPFDQRQESFRQAREALKEALSCHNGSTAPLMWIIGQSHIDLAWLWPFEETCHKSVRTYSNQLTLMEEYPEYRFLLCEPALMDTLKERDAELWGRTVAAAERGQILPEGAFYVECDTNMPSGESLIRQLKWGKKWYRENLGSETKVGWQPDTFGFSGALPQIMKKMGVPYFASQKLLRADPEAERFPYQHFWWEGIDGTSILALSFMKNNAPIDPLSLHQRWEQDRVQKTDIDTMLYPYGYGDGGGGPTRDFVEMARRLTDLEGVPRTQYGGLREYFERIESQGVKNRWVGEMYLPWHRGTYTAQRRQKALMRRLEFVLRDVERLVSLLTENPCADQIHGAWADLLLSQFHDLAGGVGIARVHKETCDSLARWIDVLQALIPELVKQVYGVRAGAGTVAWNPLPFAREEWLRLPDGAWQYARLPAAGVAALDQAVPQPQDARAEEQHGRILMENACLRLTVDAQGRIVSLLDKENGAELLEPGQVMNDWRLYKNVETVYDAWELSRDWPEGLMENAFAAKAALTRNTPECCEITVERAFGASRATQVIRLMASSRRVDFETKVDWHERRKMLKVHFESNVLAENALHEIQFGYIARPAHLSNRYAADRYERCQHRYSALCEENRGFALLNDGIYGCSANRGELVLTLLRAPLVPDDTCDRGEHAFTYSLYPMAAAFQSSGVTEEGYALNCPPVLLAGSCEEKSGLWADGAVLETVKPADDGHGMILRLYEAKRASAKATLHLPFAADVCECDMAEEETGTPLGHGDTLTVTLKPFEIKTLRVIPL